MKTLLGSTPDEKDSRWGPRAGRHANLDAVFHPVQGNSVVLQHTLNQDRFYYYAGPESSVCYKSKSGHHVQSPNFRHNTEQGRGQVPQSVLPPPSLPSSSLRRRRCLTARP